MVRLVFVILSCVFVCACDDQNSGPEADSDVSSDVTGDVHNDSDDDSDVSPDDADTDRDISQGDILDRLNALDGVTAVEVEFFVYRYFEITVEQPVDHDESDGQVFLQHLTLLHLSEEAPMSFVTTGYANTLQDRTTEIARTYEVNQLVYEHRYFGDSRPDSIDWSTLNIFQAANDAHRIVELFKTIYQGPWVSSGRSKGGMTSVFHRRFFPDDVDATVAYCSPISFGAPDERYVSFLDTVGDQDCRDSLYDLQIEALLRRTPMIEQTAELTDSDYSFEAIGGAERAFESIVLSVPFTFWQSTGEFGCRFIPDSTSDDDGIFDFLSSYVGFEYVTDDGLDYYQPYYFQAQTELGYPALRRDHIEHLLQTDVVTVEAGILPDGVSAVYDSTAMDDVFEWVRNDAERIMFIYGEFDPWTGGAFEIGDAQDSYLFIAPRDDHGASLTSLSSEEQALAFEIVESWLGIE